MNRALTIIATAFSISAFVYIYVPDKTVAAITVIGCIVLSVVLFVLENIIRTNGSQIANAIVYYFSKSDKYLIKEREFIYERLNDEDWVTTKKFEIWPKCRALDGFEDRFCWSADSKQAEVNPLYDKQTIIGLRKDERWTVYTVKFDGSVHRGDKIKTGSVISNLKANINDVEPFLATTITRKTSRIKLIVKMPERYNPRNAKLTIRSASSLVSTQDIEYNKEEQAFCVTIDYPRKKWRYSITWEND